MKTDRRYPTRGGSARRRRGDATLRVALIGAEALPGSLRLPSLGRRRVFEVTEIASNDLARLRTVPLQGVLIDDDLGAEPEVVSAIQICRAVRPDVPVIVLTGTSGTGRRLTRAGALFSLHKSGLTAAAVRSVILGASADAATSLHEHARNERTFAAAYEFSTDVIVSVTTDGRILNCNRAAVDLLGTPRELLLGQSLASVAPSEHRRSHAAMLETVSAGTPMSAFETVWRAGDGRLVPMSLSAAPMQATPGLLIGAVVVGRDTTDAKRTEELQRLASIGQLAAGVAHEINNPAAFVRGNAELLHESLAEVRAELSGATADAPPAIAALADRLDDMLQMAGECVEGVDRIAAVVRDLSVFSRIEHNDVALMSVNDLVRNACSLAGNELRHRAELDLRLGDVPNIALDRAKVAQVFLNLLVNAAHAVGDNDRSDNAVRVTTERRGDDVYVIVEDTGCGIDPDNLSRVFAPFFTTKPRGHGTGLGLAISLETVRRHGGTIAVRSRPGEGTEFEVSFPIRTALHTAELARPAVGSGRSRATSPERLRVLLVDDEPLVRRSLSRSLSRFHDVREADSGLEAIELIDGGDQFDVILCDLMMPELDGVGLWHRLEATRPDLVDRIIFVSGGAVTPHARAFIDRQQPTVMEKPVNRGELLAAMQGIAISPAA